MEPMLADFAGSSAALTYAPPRIPVVSNVTGRRRARRQDAGYWVRHVRDDGPLRRRHRAPCRARASAPSGDRPGRRCSPPLGADCVEGADRGFAPLFAPRDRDRAEALLTALARLHCRGVAMDWPPLLLPGTARVDLPTYPFQRQHYWPALEPVAMPTAAAPAEQPPAISSAPVLSRDSAFEEVRDLIRQETAEMLGYSGIESIRPGRDFLELGVDSVIAQEIRHRLSAATGLTLAPGLLFAHQDPDRLARHLMAEMAGTTSASPAPTLDVMFRQARHRDDLHEFTTLLMRLAEYRPSFTAADVDEGRVAVPALARLAEDGGGPRIIACCTTSLMAGPQEYARLAGALRGRYQISALVNPGYQEDEPAPADLAAALRLQVRAIRADVGAEPFILLGHSAGGLVANALAAELEAEGVGPAAVVLLDSYPPADAVLGRWIPELLDGLDLDDAGVADQRYLAWASYVRHYGDFEPLPTSAPTLLVRAGEPLGTVPDDRDWRPSWQHPHTVADATGNHFTMVGDQVDRTAQTVHDWLTATL